MLKKVALSFFYFCRKPTYSFSTIFGSRPTETIRPSGIVLEAGDVAKSTRKAVKAESGGATSSPHQSKKRNETGGKAKAKLKGNYKWLNYLFNRRQVGYTTVLDLRSCFQCTKVLVIRCLFRICKGSEGIKEVSEKQSIAGSCADIAGRFGNSEKIVRAMSFSKENGIMG